MDRYINICKDLRPNLQISSAKLPQYKVSRSWKCETVGDCGNVLEWCVTERQVFCCLLTDTNNRTTHQYHSTLRDILNVSDHIKMTD